GDGLYRHPRDEEPAARQPLCVPFVAQARECLAHRRAAHAVQLSERDFGQRLTGLVLPVDDALADFGIRAIDVGLIHGELDSTAVKGYSNGSSGHRASRAAASIRL